jgi:hypothetical protein
LSKIPRRMASAIGTVLSQSEHVASETLPSCGKSILVSQAGQGKCTNSIPHNFHYPSRRMYHGSSKRVEADANHRSGLVRNIVFRRGNVYLGREK